MRPTVSGRANPPPRLEEKIIDVLHRQADRLEIPDWNPQLVPYDLDRGDAGHRAHRPRRGRRGFGERSPFLAIGAVAAGIVLAVAISIGRLESDDRPAAPADQVPEGQVEFETSTVRLAAASIEVSTDRGIITPAAEVEVHSAPGRWNDDTSLELTWRDDDAEMRIHFEFASDGHDWWVTELQTHGGRPDPDRPSIDPDLIRAPNGEAFEGDIVLPNIRIQDATLEVFTAGAACERAEASHVIVPSHRSIEVPANRPTTVQFSAVVVDVGTCRPITIGQQQLSVSVDNTNVELSGLVDAPSIAGDGVIGLRLVFDGRVGTSELRLVVTEPTGADAVAAIAVPIVLYDPTVDADERPASTIPD